MATRLQRSSVTVRGVVAQDFAALGGYDAADVALEDEKGDAGAIRPSNIDKPATRCRR